MVLDVPKENGAARGRTPAGPAGAALGCAEVVAGRVEKLIGAFVAVAAFAVGVDPNEKAPRGCSGPTRTGGAEFSPDWGAVDEANMDRGAAGTPKLKKLVPAAGAD